MKVAFLTSYNSDIIFKEFTSFVNKNGFELELWRNNYGTVEQNVFNIDSLLYSFNPAAVIVHLEPEFLLGDFGFNLLALTIEQRKNKVASIKQNILMFISSICKNSPSSKIVFENFASRSPSYIGTLDINTEYGLTEIILELNIYLLTLKKEFSGRLIISDFHSLLSNYGKDNAYDLRMYRLAKYPFERSFSTKLFEHYFTSLYCLFQPRKKCMVVDLDNTLWGGIIGQDGIDNIQLGSSGIGESFVQFQKLLLNFYNSGIFLAICSKNNYEDAIEVIERHPDMILRKNFFSSIKINWFDKASNILAISKELNIGTDSIVFIDDNPAECELVKQQLPDVEVVNLAGDPDDYIKQLLAVTSLSTVSLTEEDLARNSMHSADELRKDLAQNLANLDEYFKSLEMKAYINVNNFSHVSRVSQLTQKTNQFNLTTRRYSNEEIKAFMSSQTHKVFTLKLVDKFGDNGIVLTAIIDTSSGNWIIDTFLMSCRVIGRQAETALLNHIFAEAEKCGTSTIIGQYFPTRKNLPASHFYFDHFFVQLNETDWKIKLPSRTIEHHITVVVE